MTTPQNEISASPAPDVQQPRRRRWILPVSAGVAVLVIAGAGIGWYATQQDQKYKLVAPATFEGLALGAHQAYTSPIGPGSMVNAEYDQNGTVVVAVAASYGTPHMAGGPDVMAKAELMMMQGMSRLTAAPAGPLGGALYCGVEPGNVPECTWDDKSTSVLITYPGYLNGPTLTAADLAHVAAETLQLRSLMEVDA